MKIYTKKGDEGNTTLFGGDKVSKCNKRVDTYGNIDEFIANLGLLRSVNIEQVYKDRIERIQNTLMNVSALIADINGKLTDRIVFGESEVKILEQEIDEMDKLLPPLSNFVIPGGDLNSTYCHIARTVCRRVERSLVELSQNSELNTHILPYFNRLSDYLFTLARVLYLENRNTNENEFRPNTV